MVLTWSQSQIIGQIGPQWVHVIYSDNTGNTTVAWELVQQEWPWIIILPDSCHHMDKLYKDINKITYFKPVSLMLHHHEGLLNELQVIKQIYSSVKYFKKSNFASAHLHLTRVKFSTKQGLKSISKTQFGGLYHSGESLCQNLKPIHHLSTKKKKFLCLWVHLSPVAFLIVQALTLSQGANMEFIEGTYSTNKFELDLSQFLKLQSPSQ